METRWWWYGQPVLIMALGLVALVFMGGLPLEGMLAGVRLLMLFPAGIILLGFILGMVRLWTHWRTWHGKADGCKHCYGPVDPIWDKCGICERRG